jgi:transcriptional regulator with XRE-family HTH domain
MGVAVQRPRVLDDAPEAIAARIHVATNLRAARVGLGLSQGQAAELCGVHQTLFSRWELGRTTPSVGVAAVIAARLGVPFSHLVAGVGAGQWRR